MIGILGLLLGFISIISVFAFIIGLYKVVFQPDDKKFGLQLLTYSVIGFVIGYGTCSVIFRNRF
jgi:uncharacterized membrane protein required for colicin V production